MWCSPRIRGTPSLLPTALLALKRVRDDYILALHWDVCTPGLILKQCPLPKEVRLEEAIDGANTLWSLLVHYRFPLFDYVELISRVTLRRDTEDLNAMRYLALTGQCFSSMRVSFDVSGQAAASLK